MLGSIAGLFENAKSNISGMFGYNETSEEIAQNLTDTDIIDAELDNLQETTTNFVQTIYEPIDEIIIGEDEPEPPDEPTAPTVEPFNAPYNEHPVDDETGFYQEQIVATKETDSEPLPQYEPDIDYENYTPTDNDPDTEQPEPPEIRPISPETWGEWENPPEDNYNPDESTIDQYTERINIANQYSIDETAFLELNDEELGYVTAIMNNISDSELLDHPDDYLESFYGDYKDATIRHTSTNIKEILDYMGNMWQFYNIDVFYNWELDEYYYVAVHLGETP